MGHWRKLQATVYPTNRCNLRCTYCVAQSGIVAESQIQKIDLEFAKQGVLDFFKEHNAHQIRFYSSGEPTQAMGVIETMVAFGRELVGERLVTEIQTNGYFSEEIARWLGENISIIWLSIDGWPEINDQYRPARDNLKPTRQILHNLRIMQERTFVGVRATVVPETVRRQAELVEYFASLGVKQIYSEPVFEPLKISGEMQNRGKITLVNIMDYAYSFLDGWDHAQRLGVFYGNSFMVNFDEEVHICCRSCIPAPHLTTDGYVSACDLGYYGNTALKDLIYGKWDSNSKKIIYFPEKIMKLRSRNTETMARLGCRNCEVLAHCSGGCMGRAYHETGDMFGLLSDYCLLTKFLWEHLPRGIKIEYLHP